MYYVKTKYLLASKQYREYSDILGEYFLNLSLFLLMNIYFKNFSRSTKFKVLNVEPVVFVLCKT